MWAEGLGVLIHCSKHSLVSSSQYDPSENENLTKNTTKALEGNREGVGIGVSCRHNMACHGCEESLVPCERLSRVCLGRRHITGGEILAVGFTGGQGASPSVIGIFFPLVREWRAKLRGRITDRHSFLPTAGWEWEQQFCFCHLSGHSVILFLEQEEFYWSPALILSQQGMTGQISGISLGHLCALQVV